jgi:hypothetical protein
VFSSLLLSSPFLLLPLSAAEKQEKTGEERERETDERKKKKIKN